MTDTIYKTPKEVLDTAKQALNKSLRDFVPADQIAALEAKVTGYGTNRKGLLGDLVEKFIFNVSNNGRPEADFKIAGVELKTTPLKNHASRDYAAKERLVFSMIDYDKIVNERWESSSFLEKNKLLLLMFYLYLESQNILDHKFKFVHMLDLLTDIAAQDVEQIKKDWEFIVAKIKRGEAHLLSEGDTYYLGACTKAKNSKVVRDQPRSRVPAKPRAFSLKQTYINYLIQKDLLNKKVDAASIYIGEPKNRTIEDVVANKFAPYIGKTDKQIMIALHWTPTTRSKNFKRLLVNRILTGTGSNRIEELEKANVTLRVVTLEHTGTLTESISFPAFDYKDLVTQHWYDEDAEQMADFHAELEMQRFLFVVFQKVKGSSDINLRKFMFWNFPMKDLAEAENVFDKAVACVNEGRYSELPKMTGSGVAHVRPHGRNRNDTSETPQGTREIKRCFWLNAKYIQGFLGL